MPFDKPTLTELIAATESDVEARLPGADARVRRSNLNVLARVQSAGLSGLYDFIDWAKDQLLVDTAEVEMLDRPGNIWGITRIAATYATGSIDLAGTNGSVIPAATLFQRSDGVRYLSNAEVTIAAGVATAAITAVVAGVGGNAVAGVAISLVAPIGGVTSGAVVAAGDLSGGADQETDAAYRARIQARIQQPPHGGAGFDYVTWTLSQPGVTRAWVYPLELGIGTVTVRFMMDDTYADGIPLAPDVAAVQAALEIVRPVTADLTVVAPVAVPLDFTITGLSPSTVAVQTAIETELTDLIRREAEPGSTLLISHIREAISIAAGESDHAVTVPAADVVHTTGQIATFGAITWG